MSAVRPLSKRAAAKARAADKLEKKKKAIADLAEARSTASAICVGRMPEEFQTWGAIRTRAYMKLVELLQYRRTLVTIKAHHLQSALSKISAISTLSIEECHAISVMDAPVRNQ